MTGVDPAFAARLAELLQAAFDAGGAAALQALRSDFDVFLAAHANGSAAGDEDAVWHGMVGKSASMLRLRGLIEKFARAQAPVLIRGESGTGKEVVARILHELSPRAGKPLVIENCAAIPETLLESVLFGHSRGAFTGAVRDHEGHFVAAHGGTLFLDEIGDTPLSMQAKLLRALQEGEIRPVGSEKVRRVNVRVLAATNRDLEQMVKEGTFREDLFYRLNVLQLTLPALRERGQDVILLARRILAAACEKAGRALHLTPEVESALLASPWPGNIRQLQNELHRVAALADGPGVVLADLSPDVASSGA
ncbi:MAG: sigma-54 interaction domain-containing protein [Planctomycetota bacterium]|jgi:transcriptional regulator with GAF, ATPase, and Fis domain